MNDIDENTLNNIIDEKVDDNWIITLSDKEEDDKTNITLEGPNLVGNSSEQGDILNAYYQDPLSLFLNGARYFIIKSGNHENVQIAKTQNVWATPPANEQKLNHAYDSCLNVILVFSVRESGQFQGLARLMGRSKRLNYVIPWLLPPGLDQYVLSRSFIIEWITKQPLWFSNCAHLTNPWNESKEIKISRDGQEIEPNVAEQLCRLFPLDPDTSLIDLARKCELLAKQNNFDEETSDSQSSNNIINGDSVDNVDNVYNADNADNTDNTDNHFNSISPSLSDLEQICINQGIQKSTIIHGTYDDYVNEANKNKRKKLAN